MVIGCTICIQYEIILFWLFLDDLYILNITVNTCKSGYSFITIQYNISYKIRQFEIRVLISKIREKKSILNFLNFRKSEFFLLPIDSK